MHLLFSFEPLLTKILYCCIHIPYPALDRWKMKRFFTCNHSPHCRSNYSRRYDNNYRRYDNIYRPTVQHINNNINVFFDMRSDTGSDPKDNDHHSNKILFINTYDYQDQNYNDTGISTRRSHGPNTSSLTNNQRTAHLWNHPRLPSNSLEYSTGWWEANQIERQSERYTPIWKGNQLQ